MGTFSTPQNPLDAWVHQNLAAMTGILFIALVVVLAVLAYRLLRRRAR